MTEREYTFKRLAEDCGFEKGEGNPKRVNDFNILTDKYVIFTDLHKGNKKAKADAFVQNEGTLCYALDHYEKNNFKLVLGGDCEELWGFKLKKALKRYNDTVFHYERKFVKKGDYLRIYGNHDRGWLKNRNRHKLLRTLESDDIDIHTAIFLGEKIVIIHGHQGDPTSDKLREISKIVVRFVTQTVFTLFGRKRKRAATNAGIREKRDDYLYEWAKNNGLLLIAGHTHRYVFKSSPMTYVTLPKDKELDVMLSDTGDHLRNLLLKEYKKQIEDLKEKSKESGEIKFDDPSISKDRPVPCYFNAGACVFSDGITGIEIDKGKIRLVWWRSARFEQDENQKDYESIIFKKQERIQLYEADIQSILESIEPLPQAA